MSFSSLASCQLPPFLQPGDLIQAIAPAGAVKSTDEIFKSIAIWQKRGYRIELGANYDLQYGYLAGDDSQRRADLAAAWQNPKCKAIMAVRGGYGTARLLEDWQWETKQPKWLIGFSDVTNLLWSLAKEGVASLHAPVLTTLAAEPDWSRERLFNYLESGQIADLQGEPGGGRATGILLPGNLTVINHLLNTPWQPKLSGVILALEDVTEYPYRIDRMLTQWRMLGVLNSIKGLALGRFSRCKPYPGTSSWSVEEVLRDRLGSLDIPLIYDLPFGHDGANAALPVGQTVYLDGEQGILSWSNSDRISDRV